MKKKKFTVKRSEWLNGHTLKETLKIKKYSALIPASVLYDPFLKKSCIIGHYLTACGVPQEKLSLKPSPKYLDKDILSSEEIQWLVANRGEYYLDSLGTHLLMHLNDTRTVSEKEREKKIQEIFQKQNITLTFED